MGRGAVSIQYASIRRAWRNSGGDEFWVQLRTNDDVDDAFGDAVTDVNTRFEGVRAGYAELNTQSPAGFVVLVCDIDDDTILTGWADSFADAIERRGLSGTLGGVRAATLPKWWSPVRFGKDVTEQYPYDPEPTAFIGWTFDLAAMIADPERRSHWHAPPDATKRISEHLASWTAPGGNQIILSRDTFKFQITDDRNVAATLAAAALATGMTGVVRSHPREERGRSAQCAPGTETMLQSIEPTPWPEHIATLRDGIIALPELTNLAFIRATSRMALAWTTLAIYQPLDGIKHYDASDNPHLLPEFVPDAHGIQVLRDAHLAHARDLSGWNITDLGFGRHLVEAPDLTPWFSTPLPDPDVVTQARRDFGDMIITKALIADNPPPWR